VYAGGERGFHRGYAAAEHGDEWVPGDEGQLPGDPGEGCGVEFYGLQ